MVIFLNKEFILDAAVTLCSKNELKDSIIDDIKLKRKSTIIAINPEKILKARKSKKLLNLLNEATYQIPDGIGVVIGSKLKKGQVKERITGIDTMLMLCDIACENDFRIFMYGSKEDTLNLAVNNLKKKYSKINIVGYINGYEKDETKVIETINKSGAQILFVALGSPKQEFWIKENFNKLNVNIFQGVGGSFDVISGNIKRAPAWMQRYGLEWFYRLVKEPKRIFRQVKLFKFIILLFMERGKKNEN